MKSNEPTKTKKAMKTMKKFLSMAALALVGAVMTSCSGDDDFTSEPQQPVNTDNVEILTTTISMDAGEQTRALTSAGVKTFAAGDQLALVYKNTSNQTVKAVSTALPSGSYGSSATFTFELVNADKTKNVTYIYPASMAKNDGTVNYDALNSQNGTLASLASNLDCCTKSAAWDGTSLPTVTLDNQFVICAFTIKNNNGSSDLTSNVTGLTVSVGTNTYTVSRSKAAGPIYVAIRPTSSASISYKATIGTDFYTKSVTGKTYTAGKIYQLGLRMESPFINGLVTVNSSNKKVRFSRGNLQYQASTNTWRFAANQYSYVGDGGKTCGNVSGSNNESASSSYSGWIDLFGWGTSGYNHGATCYQPWSTSTTNSYYRAYGNASYDLSSSNGRADWGYNTISNGGTGWRTLTKDEWMYILKDREGPTINGQSKSLCMKTKVGDVYGLIIFPDNYTHPTDVSIDKYDINYFIVNWGSIRNKYSLADWAKMEAAGAIFLPISNVRRGTTLVDGGDRTGCYWSATHVGDDQANGLYFSNSKVEYQGVYDRSEGYAVRLVKNVQ